MTQEELRNMERSLVDSQARSASEMTESEQQNTGSQSVEEIRQQEALNLQGRSIEAMVAAERQNAENMPQDDMRAAEEVDGVNLRNLDGDTSIDRDLRVGRNLEVSGEVHIHHNLVVEGVVQASNISALQDYVTKEEVEESLERINRIIEEMGGGGITSITKQMVEDVLTGSITSHFHPHKSLSINKGSSIILSGSGLVDINAATRIACASGSHLSAGTLTSAGDISLSVENGYAIPSQIAQDNWNRAAEIINELFEKVDVNGTPWIKAKYSLYTEGALSALGVGAAPSGGTGGGMSYDRLDRWADYSEGSGAVLSADLGYELKNSISQLDASQYLTGVTLNSSPLSATNGVVDINAATSIGCAVDSHLVAGSLSETGNIPLSVADGFSIPSSSSQSKWEIAATLFNELFEKVDINGTPWIKAKLSLYTEGALSALGVGDAPSGGGSGMSYDRLDSWDAYSEGAGAVLSAYLGWGLKQRIDNLEASPYTHPPYSAITKTSTGGFLNAISVDALGHVTSVGQSALKASDIPDLSSLYLTNVKTLSLNGGTQNELKGTGNININAATLLTSNATGLVGSSVDTAGKLYLSFDSGYSLPTTANQQGWENARIKLDDLFEKVTVNGVSWIKARYSLYTEGALSALGVGTAPSAGTGGGGVSYDRLDRWADYTQGSGAVLSADLGWGLKSEISSHTHSYLPLSATAADSAKLGGTDAAKFMRHVRDTNKNCNDYIWYTTPYVLETSNQTSAPTSSVWHQYMNWGTGDSASGMQFGTAYLADTSLYFRHRFQGANKAWRELLDSVNYSSYVTKAYVVGLGLPYAKMVNVNTNFGNSQTAHTTAEFIQKLSDKGMLAAGRWIWRTSWSYAGNWIITDTGCGDIQLAGSTIEVTSNGAEYEVKITTAPAVYGISGTAPVPNAVFVYRNNGSDYSPNWKRLANTSDLTWANISGKPTTLAGYGITDGMIKRAAGNADPNTLVAPGSYRLNVPTAHAPSGTYGQLLSVYGGGDTYGQLYIPYDGNALQWRGDNGVSNGVATKDTAWRTLLDNVNYSSYALPLSGGTLTGNLLVNSGKGGYVQVKGANYQFGLHLGSGGVNRGIYDFTTGLDKWLLYFDSANTILNYGNVGIGTSSPSYKLDIAGTARATEDLRANSWVYVSEGKARRMVFGCPTDSTYGFWQLRDGDTIKNKIHLCDDRVYMACKYLNIGEEIDPYDSRRNEIALLNAANQPTMIRLGCNGEMKWGIETRASNDSYAFSIYSWAASKHVLRILSDGNVGIGTPSPDAKLHVAGVIHATTGIYSDGYVSALGTATTSDRRLKTDIHGYSVGVEQVAALPSVAFRWAKDGKEDVGSIAQDLALTLPLCVREDANGYLGIDYGKAALLSVIATAKRTISNEERIAKLEARIEELENELRIYNGN